MLFLFLWVSLVAVACSAQYDNSTIKLKKYEPYILFFPGKLLGIYQFDKSVTNGAVDIYSSPTT